MKPLEPSPEIYVMKIGGYLYSIDKNGILIFTHLNSEDINNYKKYFNFIFLSNTPKDLEVWRNLIRLNRSLEPKNNSDSF